MLECRHCCQLLAAALFLLCSFGGPAIAQDRRFDPACASKPWQGPCKLLTTPLTNTDPRELEAIQLNCTRDIPEKLTCDFQMISVSPSLTPSEIREGVEQSLPYTLKALRDRSLEGSLCTGIITAELDEVSRQLEQKQAEIRAAHLEFQVTQYQELLRMLKLACENPTEENARALLQWGAEEENQNCRIETFPTARLEFERKPDGRWVHFNGPIGECDELTIRTLSFESNTPLWTYEQRVIVGKSNGECRKKYAEVKETTRYSWQDMPKQRQCETVSF